MRVIKRVGLISGAVVLVLSLLAAGAWWGIVPNHRPGLRAGESFGIDVSHHQERVDFAAAKRDGIRFAYLKATEGATHLDTRFVERWKAATDAGLRVGAYHFFTLCTPGADQAAHFVDVLRGVGALDPAARVLPQAIDLELAGNCSTRPPRADVVREIRAFRAGVEAATGRPTIAYLGRDFEGRFAVRDEVALPLWTFRPFRRPSPPRSLVIWQVHGFAHVDGISGRVDLDVADLAALDRL